MSVAFMNDTQPGFPNAGTGLVDGIVLRDKWVHTYNNPAAHHFPHSGRSRSYLLATFISAILPYSRIYRQTIMDNLRAQGASPVDRTADIIVPEYVYEQNLNEDSFTLVSPAADTWTHNVWLAPTLIANDMFHPVQDEENDCFLQFKDEEEMNKMVSILHYFGIEAKQSNNDDQAEAELQPNLEAA